MKATIKRDDLLVALNRVRGVLPTRTTMPILGCVLLTTTANGSVELVATNITMTLRTSVSADVHEQGTTAISGAKLLAIVKSLSGGEVSLSVDDRDWAEVCCGDARFCIAGRPAQDFPTIPTASAAASEIPGAVLVTALGRVAWAASADPTRHHLNGVFCERRGDEIRFVATDGNRLALEKVPASDMGDVAVPEDGVIVPREAVAEIIRFTEKADTVRVSFGRSMLSVAAGGDVIISSYLDAEYVQYERVIPSSGMGRAVFSRERLIQALDRVSILSEVRADGGRVVTVQIDNGRTLVSAEDPQVGRSEDSFAVDDSDDGIRATFNPALWRDCFATLTCDRVEVGFHPRIKCAVVTEPDSTRFVSVLMGRNH